MSFEDKKERSLAFVINTLKSGGAERVVSIIANHLAKNNKITIITLSKMTPFYPLDPSINVQFCKEEIPPSRNIFQSIRSNLYLAKQIHRILKANEVDLCISFMTTTNILSVWATMKLRIPLILSERNNPQFEDVHLSPFWKFLRKLAYPKANIIVVQTKAIRDYFLASTSKDNYRIIPNPVNPDFTLQTQLKRENIILNVGRLANQKGQDTLIKVFADLPANDWELYIVGEGPKRNELQELIKQLHMEERIFLPGRTDQIEKYYQRSKIFAFTSLYEGFPNALMEAMFFGLACVSTDCPTGPSELIKHGYNGLLAQVNDKKSIKEALHELMISETKRDTFGKAASVTMQSFTVDKITKEWETLIESLLTTS